MKNDRPHDRYSGPLFNGSDLHMAGRALSEKAKDPAVKLVDFGTDLDLLLDTHPNIEHH
jgi:hypothetical protein